MTYNRYAVTDTKWARWTEQARTLFNNMYAEMLERKPDIQPKGMMTTKNGWERISWNAAWIAADHTSAVT